MREKQQTIRTSDDRTESVIKLALLAKKGDRFFRQQQYEYFKRELSGLNLSADDYEQAVRRLAEALGI